MADQPSYRPLEASSFFANGQSSRHLVAGTVARGHLEIDAHFYTGRKPGANRQAETARTEHPLPVGKNVGGTTSDPGRKAVRRHVSVSRHSRSFGARARPLHDLLRRLPRPASEQVAGRSWNAATRGRRRITFPGCAACPVGHLFAVVSEGYGSMPSYAGQISPRDRWAIVAYVRALQLSQHFPADQLTPEMKSRNGQARQPGKEGPVSNAPLDSTTRLLWRWEKRAFLAGCVALADLCAGSVSGRGGPVLSGVHGRLHVLPGESPWAAWPS